MILGSSHKHEKIIYFHICESSKVEKESVLKGRGEKKGYSF